MKQYLKYFLIFLLFILNSIFFQLEAQNSTEFIVDSINPIDCSDFLLLKEKYKLDSTSLNRYRDAISEFEKKDKQNPPKKNSILFVGSSTIALWKTRLEKDMNPLPVINRGFGGSVLLENIYYYPRIIKPYHPKVVVLYCENDIVNNTPSVIFEKIRYFEYLLHNDFPKCKLIIVSFKPSIARKEYLDKMIIVNKKIMEYSNKRPNTEFIDIFNSMISNGEINESLFINDKLHMNDKGYDLWTQIIKPIVQNAYSNTDSALLYKYNQTQPKIFLKGKFLWIDNCDMKLPIKLFNLSGNLVSTTSNTNTPSLSAYNLSNGIYFIDMPPLKTVKIIVP